MKTLLALTLVGVLGVSSCAPLGIGTGGDTATRILADLGCLTAATVAGITIAGDPSVNGAVTVMGVANAIAAVGTSSTPATVLAACKDTLSYLAADVAGLGKLVTGASGAPVAKLAMRATAPGPVPKAPLRPTPVTVIIPR